MIWLTWRQFRIQAIVAGLAVAALAVVLAVTGPDLVVLYRGSGLATCSTGCLQIADVFFDTAMQHAVPLLYYGGSGLLYLAPGLIGIFWGAPLVAREFESGTHRLVWSQSVGRQRWLGVKLAGVGLAAVLTTGLISLALTWWARPLDAAAGRINPLIFGARGVVPLGFGAFAFVAGVTIGLMVRRVVPAMAGTLLFVAVVQIVVPYQVREHLAEPVHYAAAYPDGYPARARVDAAGRITVVIAPPVPGTWVVDNRTLGADGNDFDSIVPPDTCGPGTDGKKCQPWLDAQHLRQDIRYFPAGRFWTLQWRELVLYAVATVLLAFFCLGRIRRGTA